jgi:hypothetical protein
MDIDDLTVGQAKQLAAMFGESRKPSSAEIDLCFSGAYVLVRTNSAGIWAGNLDIKSGNEVILSNARRLWLWKAKQSISLSAIALYGIDDDNSRIAPPVPNVWLEAIEILPFAGTAGATVYGAKHAEAR